MTPEEKVLQHDKRNEAICKFYLEGNKLAKVASRFKLSRQRVLYILQKAGVWKPYVKTDRNQFLGISVTKETKERLKQKAKDNDTSVSQLISDAAEGLVRE